MRRLVIALALCLAGPAQAYDLALVIGNRDYERLPDVAEGGEVGPIVERLRRAGFEVVARTDADRRALNEAVERFVARAPGAERLLVVLDGHFLRSDRDWFLIPVDGRETSLAKLPRRALPVSALMSVLASKPAERAVMVLGTSGRSGEVSPYLRRGLVSLPEEPGFVMIGGAAGVTDPFVRDTLAVPGQAFDARDLRRLDVAIEGLADPPMTFVPEGRELAPPEGGDPAEREVWEAVRRADTERAYVGYLDRFPEGAHAGDASRRLDALRRDPARRAREGEDELNLGREDRRRIQTALSVLGFDPRGVDGIFGPGTRAAVGAWQRSQNLPETGYLAADQLARLSDQAVRRAAEREAEAEAQRAETRRLDEAYWDRAAGEGAAGLRAYLERFPNGLHADEARERLGAFQSEARGSAALADARDWDEARAADRAPAYRRYLEAHPEGAFAEAARARIGELRERRGGREAAEAATAAEDALGLTPVTRGLVEGRLEAFGFEPGAVDGVFDDATRRAIRRYQRSRGLEPTGHLDQGVVARILADSILR